MKSIFTVALFFLVVCSVSANDYQKEMVNTISALLKVDENPTEYMALATKFENLSELSKDDWLPPYYAALSKVWATFSDEDKDNADAILDDCTNLLNLAEKLGGDKSEILCLRSMVASARITVSVMTRGMKYGLKATSFIEDAEKANPNNPRVYFVKAQSLIFTPVMFGGGCDNAIPFANTAIKKYKAFSPNSKLHPNWGQAECLKLVKECD